MGKKNKHWLSCLLRYIPTYTHARVLAFHCRAYLYIYIYIAWLTSLFRNRPYTQAEVSLRDSHRVEQCNIKFHIGESVYCSGRGPQLTRLWLMAPVPSPNDCSPSLLAINKNIIYIFIFIFLFTQSALSRSFHSYPPFTLHHAHVNLGTIKHLTQDM